MNRVLKKIMPLVILSCATGVYAVMQLSTAKPQANPTKASVMPAEFIEAQAQTVSATVHSHGTVQPSIQTMLSAEVAGNISRVAAGFHIGGVFSKGDLLLEIESQDYREAVLHAEAALARAQMNLASEKALARQAERNWMALGTGEPTALALRQPQLAQALAETKAARAAVEKANRDLSKTRIRAPYALMVHSTDVGLHQYITPGTPLARIFSVDSAQVRLPVTDEELDHLDIGIQRSILRNPGKAPSVQLRTTLVGGRHFWQGKIVRAESIYDPKTRLTHVVAQVDDPYGFNSHPSHPPLAMGMFVEAQIEGKKLVNRIVLPPRALCDADTVWVIREDNTLAQRKISVLFTDAERTVVGRGLSAGERVCLSDFEYATDGMVVKPVASKSLTLANLKVRE